MPTVCIKCIRLTSLDLKNIVFLAHVHQNELNGWGRALANSLRFVVFFLITVYLKMKYCFSKCAVFHGQQYPMINCGGLSCAVSQSTGWQFEFTETVCKWVPLTDLYLKWRCEAFYVIGFVENFGQMYHCGALFSTVIYFRLNLKGQCGLLLWGILAKCQ